MTKADLHIHSTVSDGSLSVAEIVERAKNNGLDAIAITDHDTLAHAALIAQNPPIKVLAGIEISAFDYETNVRVHVLGYNIQDAAAVESFTKPLLEARHANSLKQIAILNANGYPIDAEQLPKANGKYIYKQHIMDYLVSAGRVNEMFGEFYYHTFKNKGICDFDIEYLNPFEAVRVIKKAGGQAVLAHSGQQQNFHLIPKLVACGLDGLELNHHANSAKDQEIIREYAALYKLFLTGGSDFHGRYELNSPDIGDYISDISGVHAIVEP